ncbi:hypothetical protein BY996DRAFT_4548589, partial [Phakopsora pachyrhizi]
HRVRFECQPNDADRSGISQPGTIVDKVIGDPFLYNCFLKVETNHTVDDPQNIANSVCSASQRATKSVGITTPTCYSNLV